MKISIFIKSLAFALALCFGLFHVGYADAPSYSVSVTTPSGPNDIKVGNGTTYYPYTSTATLINSGSLGELIKGNYRYKWGSGIKSFTGRSSDPNGGFNPASQSAVVSTFQTADAPPKDLSTSSPTTLRVDYKNPSWYQITLNCTITFDLLNQDGTVNTANLTASGSVTCQVNVEQRDFSLSDNDQLVIPIEGNANTAVKGYSINGFEGNVALNLNSQSTPNPADPVANPAGVSGLSSVYIPNAGSATAQMNIKVGSNATPGKYPLTIYGVGSTQTGPTITHNTTAALTIPKRYVEIHGPLDGSSSASGLNVRRDDGFVRMDTVLVHDGDVKAWRTGAPMLSDNGLTITITNKDGSNGFKPSPNFGWKKISGAANFALDTVGFFGDPTQNPSSRWNIFWDDINDAKPKEILFEGYAVNQNGTLHTSNIADVFFHFPYENWHQDPTYTPLPHDVPFWPDNDASGKTPTTRKGGAAVATFTVTNNYLSDEARTEWEITLGLLSSRTSDPKLSTLFAALQLYSQTFHEKTQTPQQSITFDPKWKDAVTAFQTGKHNSLAYFSTGSSNQPTSSDVNDLGKFYQMEPFYQAQYLTQHWVAETYGPKGFTGMLNPAQPRTYYTGGAAYGGVFSRAAPGGNPGP